MATVRTVGLIVNPVAGMGGAVGLKGTDGPLILAEAIRRGAAPTAEPRTARALARLARLAPGVRVLSGSGALGGDVARRAGFDVECVTGPHRPPTTAADTVAVARALVDRSVALLMFAGGDGTARDVMRGIGSDTVAVGIPTGVKMHSAVFAGTPEAAAEAAARFLSTEAWQLAEVADIDERAAREDHLDARLHGTMRVPADRRRIVGLKTAHVPADDTALDGVAQAIVETMQPGRLYLVGPGTSTARITARIGARGTLLGVDAIRDRKLIAVDLDQGGILTLLGDSVSATLFVGVTGGQGSVFGRGNQQLSAAVLRRIGPENITVIVGPHKLAALSPAPLRVDTGDPDLDARLSGHRRVLVGPGRELVVNLAH